MKTFAVRIAVLAVLWSSIAASGQTPRDLGSTLATVAQKYNLPGAVGAILHGDQIVAIGSTGIRKAGDPTPFLSDDVIHLGSDTKAMTAILIGQLIDQKQITFDTTVSEIFPQLAPKMNSDAARITMRQLLDHDAGFPHDLDWRALQQTKLPLIQQRHLAVEQALSVPPATPIGSYSYSNVGDVVLGAIVESKTGEPWEKVIQQKIFQPLGMTTAGFGPPGTAGKVDQPWGHVNQNGALKPTHYDNAPVMGPAATVHCSIADWSKFIAEILNATHGHPTLASLDAYQQLLTPMPNQEYAGGWLIAQRPWAGGVALTHQGSDTTWTCVAWIALQKNFALLIATNYGDESITTNALDQGITEMIKFNSELPPN